jgi:hypothetical protein
MALKRIEPVIKRCELGFLRLWRDELAEIVRLAGQLNGTAKIESDGFEVEDVDADLPQIGERVEYFAVTITGRDENATLRDLLNLRLSLNQSYIEAIDPNAQTQVIISNIQSLADKCRRPPRWLIAFTGGSSSPILAILALIIIALALVIDLLVVRSHLTHLEWGIFGLAISTAGIVVGVLLIAVLTMSSTVLFTGTRAQAPTWWQRHGTDIFIQLAIAAGFFLLGLFVGHL